MFGIKTHNIPEEALPETSEGTTLAVAISVNGDTVE